MWRWISLYGGAVLVAAISLLPLNLAIHLSGAPVEAERITGTVWKGELRQASLEGYALGDIDVSAKLLPLLTGRLKAAIEIRGATAQGAAVVTAQRHALSFDETDARVNIAALRLKDAFGAPMSGMVDIKADKLRLTNDGQCLGGEVILSTDTLQRSAIRYGGEGFVLSGVGRCLDGAFELPLTGTGPEGTAHVSIRVSRSGYQTELIIEPTDQQLAAALSAYGFEQRGGRYSLIQRGDVF